LWENAGPQNCRRGVFLPEKCGITESEEVESGKWIVEMCEGEELWEKGRTMCGRLLFDRV
jgi:hypothetical protein